MHVDASSTVDELYKQSKVKILRLYLFTRKKTQQQPQDVEADHAITQPSVVDLTDNEPNQATDDLLVENINSEPSNHFVINDGASISGYLELNDTLPWDGLPTVGESEDSDAVAIISGDNRVDISVVELNPETPFTEKESDPPHHTSSLSRG